GGIVKRTNKPGGLLNLGFGPDIRKARLRLVAGFYNCRAVVLDDIANVELQAPAIVSLLCHTPELESADLGRTRRQCDGNVLGAAALPPPQDRVQWRHAQELIRLHLKHIAGAVVA